MGYDVVEELIENPYYFVVNGAVEMSQFLHPNVFRNVKKIEIFL